MTNITFSSEGKQYCVLLPEIQKSLRLITKQSSLLQVPTTHLQGLLPEDVIAMSGIYVDDYLTAGPPSVVHDLFQH